MLKFLAKIYDWLLIGLLFYFILFMLSGSYIDKVYGIDPYESINATNIDAHDKAERLRSILRYILWGYAGVVNAISLVLICVPEGKIVRKWILVLVVIVSALLFFMALLASGVTLAS
jgi:hypothetical protein